MTLVRHLSFVDCPGHDILMKTMMAGATIMDGALLLIACNEFCPQPQTLEHLAALEIMELKNVILIQNKIDLIAESEARLHYRSIRKFIRGTTAQSSKIIPISAQIKQNIDVVCDYLVSEIPIPRRKISLYPLLAIIRSFDVNRPGTKVDDLKGGIAGGTIFKGVLKIGQEIEIRPGIVRRDKIGK